MQLTRRKWALMTSRMVFLANLVGIFVAYASPASESPHAKTACGTFVGVYRKIQDMPAVSHFLGIPFAKPPTGRSGRWKPAREPECRNGTFAATTMSQSCMQYGHTMPPPIQGESEDCLYLNVYTPAALNDSQMHKAEHDSELLPVMVWIYGGDSNFGYASSYGSVENLVALSKGKIVLVSINYRLASLGWLATRALAREDPRGSSGNYGVTDCQMALQWVQRHIRAFGGDASRVTVFGQSSGGTQIFAMLASPASKGLFHRAISLSGSVNISVDLATTQDRHEGFVKATGCAHEADVLGCLYGLSAKDALEATPASWDPQFSGFHSSPDFTAPVGEVIVDGVTVTKPLLDAVQTGLIQVPLVISSMQAEMDLSPNASVDAWTTAQQFNTFCDQQFSAYDANVSPGLQKTYKTAAEANASLAYYTLNADIGQTCASRVLARQVAVLSLLGFLSCIKGIPRLIGFRTELLVEWR
eukprot:m.634974 g.634974  ORF g.634974 m.634974 type:complete len:473 (-) comp22581_c0_seq72:231-1649(-)